MFQDLKYLIIIVKDFNILHKTKNNEEENI